MATSSEEVLLIVKNVRNKKCDGVLYMMGQRMAWLQQSKHNFTISYQYAEIKAQKISPTTKEKVQLQVVLQDGGANTFHYDNPISREAQQADREACKELLQNLLPKFRKKMNTELEEKNNILQKNPELFNLYKDIVVTGIVSAEEFWKERTKLTQNEEDTKAQSVGVSAAFLAEIKPQTDGCNGLRYNLTYDVIDSIFRTYPSVKGKHTDLVPSQLTEQEFWQRFFQSHYFHRDRITSTVVASKDIFADCALQDETMFDERKKEPITDFLLDLTQLQDVVTIPGYGTKYKNFMMNASNAALIKRFNQHSNMVLMSSQSNKTKTKTAADIVDDIKNYKKRMLDQVNKTDLSTPEDDSANRTAFQIEEHWYTRGPAAKKSRADKNELMEGNNRTHRDLLSWKPMLHNKISSTLAANVLGELSPGGSLMQPADAIQNNHIIPKDVDLHIARHYMAIYELLRHFWACFPALNEELASKLITMKETLDRFNEVILQPEVLKLQTAHYNNNSLSHLNNMLQFAFKKFNDWKQKYDARYGLNQVAT